MHKHIQVSKLVSRPFLEPVRRGLPRKCTKRFESWLRSIYFEIDSFKFACIMKFSLHFVHEYRVSQWANTWRSETSWTIGLMMKILLHQHSRDSRSLNYSVIQESNSPFANRHAEKRRRTPSLSARDSLFYSLGVPMHYFSTENIRQKITKIWLSDFFIYESIHWGKIFHDIIPWYSFHK